MKTKVVRVPPAFGAAVFALRHPPRPPAGVKAQPAQPLFSFRFGAAETRQTGREKEEFILRL